MCNDREPPWFHDKIKLPIKKNECLKREHYNKMANKFQNTKKTYIVFFYKNYFYKNHQAQNCQKIRNILRIMARLKYMITNLESPILILHQESALFTMECLLFTMEGLQFRKTCVRNQHTN